MSNVINLFSSDDEPPNDRHKFLNDEMVIVLASRKLHEMIVERNSGVDDWDADDLNCFKQAIIEHIVDCESDTDTWANVTKKMLRNMMQEEINV
jgi:hypothetical protein